MSISDSETGPKRPKGRSYYAAWEQGYKGREIHGPLFRVARSLRVVLDTYNSKVRINLDAEDRRFYQHEIAKWLLHIETKVFPSIRKQILAFDCPHHWDKGARKWVPTTAADRERWKAATEAQAEKYRQYREQRIFEREGRAVKFDVKKVGRDTRIAKKAETTIIGLKKGKHDAQDRKKRPR